MSERGYPVDMNESVTVHSSYVRSSDGVVFPGSDTCFLRSLYEDKAGQDTPGWPFNIQTNSYSRSYARWNQSPLDVVGRMNNGDTFFGQWGNTFGIGYNPSRDIGLSQAFEINLVRDMLIGKIADQIQSHRVNLGEAFHTRAQTADMVADAATRIARSFTALKRGGFRAASHWLFGSYRHDSPVKRAVGGIPEQWLALQYGWKPLLQDVYNSCETVRRAWNDNGDAYTAKSSAHTDAGDRSIVVGPILNGPQITYYATQRRVAGKAAITYSVGNNLFSSLSQLGITNPLSLAWELLPYSFVVDWFIPIGSFLERLTYSSGLVFNRGWISIRASQEFRSRLTNSHGSLGGDQHADWSGGTGSGHGWYFVREALSNFPAVGPPRFKDPFSLTHVANALSLLATAFRG